MTTTAEDWIERLQPWCGREQEPGAWLEIDQTRIDAFAAATGDVQWIHTDPARAAAESPYGRTLAHGFLTLALLPLLTAGNTPASLQHWFPGARLRVNYGLNRLRFPAPVLCGDRVRARSVLQQVVPVSGGVEATYLFTVEIAGKEKPALVAEQLVRVYA